MNHKVLPKCEILFSLLLWMPKICLGPKKKKKKKPNPEKERLIPRTSRGWRSKSSLWDATVPRQLLAA